MVAAYHRNASTPFYGSVMSESEKQQDHRVMRNTLLIFLTATGIPSWFSYRNDPHHTHGPSDDGYNDYEQDSFGRY